MAWKSVEEQKAYSDKIEAQAQEYKRSKAYQDALRKKREAQGKVAQPTAWTGDVYGSKEQIRDRLVKQYEAGKIPADISAEIVDNPDRPGQYAVYFSETAGYKSLSKPSVIKYYDKQDIPQPVSADGGRFVYEVDVDSSEQARDVKIWAAAHGHEAKRYTDTADIRTAEDLNKLSADERREAGKIKMRIYTEQALPENTSIDIRSSADLQRERSEQLGKVMGKKIYDKADPLEKGLLHVRTLLSPQGWGYVGAAAKEYGGPVEKAIINFAFPGVKSTEDVVLADIEQRTARRARGETTYKIMGVDVDERIVSAISNPVVEVEMMFLGGAGAAKVAGTKIGAKVLGSTAGKVAAAGITGLYAGERTGKILTLKAEGRETEALGTAITTIAGLGAGYAGFKAEYSHIVKATAQHTVKIDVSKLKGASISKQVGKSTTVSKGKFVITEGKLKGLKGETVSITGKKGGLLTTKIPAQKIGTGKSALKIQEQVFRDFTQHGVVSKQLKISWRKAGDMLLQIKGPGGSAAKVVGSRKSTTLMQEIGRTQGTARFTKKVPGGKITSTKDVIVRKFSGITTGSTARKYDLYLIKKGTKLFIAEKALIDTRALSKVDWVDISPVSGGSGGGGSSNFPGLKIIRTTGGRSTTVPGTSSATVPKGSPAIPSAANVKIQSDSGVTIARIVPNLNPVPLDPRIKRDVGLTEISLKPGAPKIARRTTTGQKGRVVTPVEVKLALAPAILRESSSGKIKEVTLVGTNQIPIPVTHPITGQEVSIRERTAVLETLEPLIDRVPSQPVPATPVAPNIPPPVVIPGLGMIPFLYMGKGKFNIDKMIKGVKTNPVPDIRKVI